MLLKRALLLLALSGIIINADAAKRLPEGLPEDTPEAKERRVEERRLATPLEIYMLFSPAYNPESILLTELVKIITCNICALQEIRIALTSKDVHMLLSSMQKWGGLDCIGAMLKHCLLDEGVLLSAIKNEQGYTALILACQQNDLHSVKILLFYDMKLALICDKLSLNTPLHWAVYKGHVNIVQELLTLVEEPDRSSMINQSNGDGSTALTIAQEIGCDEIIAILKD